MDNIISEWDIHLNNETRNTSTNDTGSLFNNELPKGVLAVTPFLLLLFIVALISNVILMALIIKACKVNSSINVYLFSLSVAGLMETIGLFLLTIVTVTRRFVFGTAVCTFNFYLLIVANLLLPLLHLVISRDRYKVVKDPLKSPNKTKRAYAYSTVLWITTLFLGILITIWLFVQNPVEQEDNGHTDAHLVCLGLDERILDQRHNNENTDIFRYIALLIAIAGSNTFLLVVTLAHYVWIFKELRAVERHRADFKRIQSTSPFSGQILQVNGRDKPLHTTGEERAARSLAIMYLVQFACATVSQIAANILIVVGFTQSLTPEERDSFIVACVFLMLIYFVPTANPGVLILANKKFRKRVIGLLKCELNPDDNSKPQDVHIDPNSRRYKECNNKI